MICIFSPNQAVNREPILGRRSPREKCKTILMDSSATHSVKLFGMLKTLVPGGLLYLPLPPGAQVKDFVALLCERCPEVGNLVLQKKVLVSVNQEIAHWETEISNADEIALLPPFAGGSQSLAKDERADN